MERGEGEGVKELLILRHAKSSWASPALDDIDRPLNKRGKRDAPLMGEQLRKRGFMPDYVMSSPARRARKTAKHIVVEIGFPSQKIVIADAVYLADETELRDIIRSIDNRYSHVMIVGHNPGFTALVNSLSDFILDNLPTCGMACVRFNIQVWAEICEGRGSLVFFDYPKKIGLL